MRHPGGADKVPSVPSLSASAHSGLPTDHEGRPYIRKKITYGSDLSSRVTAYLLIPNNVKRGAPAMLCLHDDTPRGKDEPAGLGGRDSLRYADELVKRGYVCLVHD